MPSSPNSRPSSSADSSSTDTFTTSDLLDVFTSTGLPATARGDLAMCSICLEPFQTHESILQHGFCRNCWHAHCLWQALQYGDTCPVCRGRIKSHEATEPASDDMDSMTSSDESDEEDDQPMPGSVAQMEFYLSIAAARNDETVARGNATDVFTRAVQELVADIEDQREHIATAAEGAHRDVLSRELHFNTGEARHHLLPKQVYQRRLLLKQETRNIERQAAESLFTLQREMALHFRALIRAHRHNMVNARSAFIEAIDDAIEALVRAEGEDSVTEQRPRFDALITPAVLLRPPPALDELMHEIFGDGIEMCMGWD